MAKKRSGMGKRGLSALIEGKQKAEKQIHEARIEKLPITAIQPGTYQPRQQFEEAALQDLAESIKQQGLVQPIVVKPMADEQYEIIAGERRWRAAQMAGLETVPVIIRQADNQETIAMALIENIQREDLNPIETAMGLKRFMQEFELTQKEVAEAVGRSRTGVTNLLRLLKLPQSIQDALHRGELTMGHARAIITLPENLQLEIVEKILQRGWSVRETEAYVQSLLVPTKGKVKKTNKPQLPDHLQQQQQRLSEQLGHPIKINHRPTGKGKIEIAYDSEESLQTLLKSLVEK